MAGMIYDANQTLNWIIDDPNITEAFRNSSVIGSRMSSTMSLADGKKDSDSKAANKIARTIESANNNSSGSLANLFSNDEERDLLGIGFFTIWEAGIVLSGYCGTGIVLSRNIMNGEWSGPVAVGVSGVGAGLQIGASVRSIVYLIYDYFTLKSIIGTDGGVIFGLGAGATIGTWTKNTGKQTAYITSPKMLRTAGIGSNIALVRGLAGFHGAVSIKAGICKPRDKINARFYGKEPLSGSDILLSGDPIEIPNSSRGTGNVGSNTSNYQAKRLMEIIQSKLKKLCAKEDPQAYISSSHPEDIRATLEELYADESYDNFGDYQMEIKDDDIDDKDVEDSTSLFKEDESNTVSKTPSLTKEGSASPSKIKDSESEEEDATQTSSVVT